MFKKTQKYLLLNYPLLWNTKAVPLTCFLIVMHVIFLVIGYIDGALNFNETEQNYNSSNEGAIIFFSVLISFLTFVIWLVYYFKNNAFKAFYPKGDFSLFKEWCLILLISFLVSTFALTYELGCDLRIKSYYSENEAKKRCETLSKASIFYGQNYDEAKTEKRFINDSTNYVVLDYMLFKDKKYPLNSLLNKDIENYSFFDAKWDSLTKVKVKSWLVNDNKDSVKAVMKNYFDMVKEHQLVSNIDENQWFSLVYNFPEFEQKRVIAKRVKDFYNNGDYNYDYDNYDQYATEAVTAVPLQKGKIDSINEYLKVIGRDKYVYYKTYIPADQLEYNYQKIADTYVNSSVTSEMFLIFLYFAMGLSIVVFSFKATSGRNWLIALVSMGVLNILLGIAAALSSSEYFYIWALLIITLVLFGYFIIVIANKTKKGISGITLNALLWLFPAFIPLVYTVTLQIMRYTCGYYRAGFKYENHPTLKFLKDNDDLMLMINFGFIFLMMAFFSIKIKAWRALADS
ncbi:hypothetical protein [Flavobacterium sp. 102]|uniref:hypothetical protein n=1 Tax=Flavobacterium sp. 102 TaxID=2135623 RepID=UPI000EB02F8F|nr:hypothetical protein [Flavobacterium sp. 102]RKS02496.1 hypothetical protein C8C84_2215 [Flavobacterium sp. 102]